MDYQTELQALKDAQNRIAQEQLGMQKTSQLGQIATQEAELKPKYQQERNKATAGSQLQAKSFAEFLANRGGTFSGLAGQGEINRQNLLNTNIGAIDTAQRGAETQLQQARTGVEQDYAQGLAKAQGANELGYLQGMFNVKQSQAEAAQREKEARIKTASSQEGKITKIANIPLSYRTGLQGVKDGENVVYNIPNQDGSITQASFALGTNPFTGTMNKNLKNTEGKYDPINAFSNGYQPNNYKIGGKTYKLTKENVVDRTTVNGQEQNVWKVGNTNIVWDGPSNDFFEVIQSKGNWVVK